MMQPQLEQIAQYDDDKGLTPFQALAELQKRSMRSAMSSELDVRLQSDQWKQEKEMYHAWCGPFTAYGKPDEMLGKRLSFAGLTFNVPEKFQEESNMAVVCNTNDLLIKGSTITPGKSAQCIPFPKTDGWYLPDKVYGIPNGQPSNEGTPAARKLWRRDDEAFAGLLVRGDGWFGDGGRRDVSAYYWPDVRLGVFVVTGEKTKR